MRRAALALIVLMLLAGIARAQTTFRQGYYDFESYVSSMTYSGSWSTAGSNPYYRATTAASAYVEFSAAGNYLIIWRFLYTTTAAMDVCVDASCQSVSNTSTATGFYPVAISLSGPGTTNTVRITRTSGQVTLDAMQILTTPLNTATPAPSSTPAPTSTPQPTWTLWASTTPQPTWTLAPSVTPQPTATPYSAAASSGVVWSLDLDKEYQVTNGQQTSVQYTATAADVHIANLLTLLLFSVWGFFLFAVFVLVRYRR